MMKKIIYSLIVVLLLSCNGENVPDCFQNSGDIIQQEFSVANFTEITVLERIELIIKEAPNHSVVVETGEYLMNDIEVNVQNGKLVIKNNNSCNLTRDYGLTKVFVMAPNITKIRSSTSLPIRSDGVLNYNAIELRSEDVTNTEVTHTDGIFDLNVNCNTMLVVVNNLSSVFIEGNVNDINIQFVSGDSRFEGRHLIAENINIFHRGTNDIIVNPQQSLTANLVSTGNVIAVSTPPELDVQEQYTGRVIYE